MIRRYLPLPLRRAIGWLRSGHLIRRTNAMTEMLSPVKAGEVLINSSNLRGEYWLDVRSHLFRRIAIHGEYEPAVSTALAEMADRDFIDVGANVGFFSIHMALQPGWDGRVLAIEPNPRAFHYLERNLKQNGVAERVEAVECAVTEETAQLKLTAFEGREEYSTTSNAIHPSVRDLETTTYTVSGSPLDAILEDRNFNPGLVKIDAEGAELAVLRGMQKTIDRFRPILVCEVGGGTYGSPVSEIEAVFSAMKYELLGLDGRPARIDRTSVREIIARPLI